MNIVLIAGWGLGIQALKPLAMLLKAQHQITMWDIFDPFIAEIRAEKLAQLKNVDVLIGWSLGGQLAIYLADCYAKQTGQSLAVIACMSNPCFVAQPNWSSGMSAKNFAQFNQHMQQHPENCLKNFCSLVCLGSAQPRQRAKSLQNSISDMDLNYQASHLYLLNQLSLVNIVQKYSGKMLFIFCKDDYLVPYKITQESLFLSTINLNFAKIDAAHDAIMFDTSLVLEPILTFLKQKNQSVSI